MIRHATPADLPVLLRHGRAFVAALPYAELITFDAESFGVTLLRVLQDDILLVAEEGGTLVGMAAMAIYPAFHNARALIAQELFWWVEPGCRNGVGRALLEELEAEARRRGAALIRMACVTGLRHEALGRLYERRGYVEADRGYMRGIEA